MKTFFLGLFIFIFNQIFGQIVNDTLFSKGQNYLIYNSPLSGIKIKSQDLISLISPFERSVFFFYPDIDSAKRLNYDNQIKELAAASKFSGAKIIGIPFTEAKTDEANVRLDSYIITGIQCIIYTKDDKDLVRAVKMNSEIIRDQKGLPSFFSRIDVNKEELCVKENRIIFFEKIINEFLTPQLSSEEKMDLVVFNQNELLKKIILQNEQITELKIEIEELKKIIVQQSNVGNKK